MSSELTEEEMRRALFGTPQPEEQISAPLAQEPVEEVVLAKPVFAPAAKKKVARAFTPRLRVTLRVGNDFEGKMIELIHTLDKRAAVQALAASHRLSSCQRSDRPDERKTSSMNINR